MGRSFTFVYGGQQLTITPIAVDEGWELWVMEGGRRLTCAARISVDEVVMGGRKGRDIIQLTVDQVRARILSIGLAVGSQSGAPKGHCTPAYCMAHGEDVQPLP
jgi:hypothetical protein